MKIEWRAAEWPPQVSLFPARLVIESDSDCPKVRLTALTAFFSDRKHHDLQTDLSRDNNSFAMKEKPVISLLAHIWPRVKKSVNKKDPRAGTFLLSNGAV